MKLGAGAPNKLTFDGADDLIAEIRRYLETVALCRKLGCEPRWRRETATCVALHGVALAHGRFE